MSLASLARESVRRPPAATNNGQDDNAKRGKKSGQNEQKESPNGMESLTRYIPVETITIYVAAMASLDQLAKLSSFITPWMIYCIMAVLTPVILMLLVYREQKIAGDAIDIKKRAWPIFASFLAFLVWGLSVPGHPVAADTSGLFALLAMVLSTFLALFDPIWNPEETELAKN